MVRVEKTRLNEIKLIHVEWFEDHRGEYVETYNKSKYFDAGITIDFVQDDYSLSTKGVLRGVHGDTTTWKLISCPYGKFYLVVLNNIEGSQQYGQWESFVLSEKNKKQVLIPPGFGNGHLVLSKMAIFSYKQSTNYDPKSQFSIRWNDPIFKMWWPTQNPILSRRDEVGHYVE
jgi:dTDP-4-dehydrorhamnose 3,5-epimerase